MARAESELVDLAEQAVAIAPKEPDVLYLAAWVVTPFGPVNRSVRRFIKDCYKRLDRLGGPSARVLNEMGGEAEFRRERKRLGV